MKIHLNRLDKVTIDCKSKQTSKLQMPLSLHHLRIVKSIVRVVDLQDRHPMFDALAHAFQLPRHEWMSEWQSVLNAIKCAEEPVYNVPLPATNELCYFLGRPAGTWMSRTDAFNGLVRYVKNRGLLKKRVIVQADRHVASLLRLAHNEPLILLYHVETRMDHLFEV